MLDKIVNKQKISLKPTNNKSKGKKKN